MIRNAATPTANVITGRRSDQTEVFFFFLPGQSMLMQLSPLLYLSMGAPQWGHGSSAGTRVPLGLSG